MNGLYNPNQDDQQDDSLTPKLAKFEPIKQDPTMVPQTAQLAEMNKEIAQRQAQPASISDAVQQVANIVANPLSAPSTGQIIGLKEGGVAAAQKAESLGRGEDKVLVHMTPKEVRGLQAIAMAHGGTLTINPETGLIEAGFLDSILPTVAGAALMMVPGMQPLGAAALVGGGMWAATGSLEKGLLAGLGAFGGAGIGQGLMSAGANAAPAGTIGNLAAEGAKGAQAVAASGGAAASPYALTGGTLGSGASVGGGAIGSGLTTTGAGLGFNPAVGAGTTTIGGGSLFSAAPAGSGLVSQGVGQSAAPSFMDNLTQAGRGLSNMVDFSSPAGTQAREAFIGQAAQKDKEGNIIQKATGLGGGMGALKTVGMAAAPMFFDASSGEPAAEPGKPQQQYIRPYAFDYQKTSDIDPNFKYRTGAKGESTAEQRYFTPTFTPMGVFKAGTEPGGSFYGTPTDDLYKLYSGPKYAEGGIAKGGLKDGAFVVPADVVSHLGNGSNDAGQKILARGLDAHPIKGKGDGMSDSIPTTIEGKQPARVADGEAYIPPEVVKKVGAKRLYSMMDKIRHARTGSTKQAPEVDPRKFLPA